jgi:hypothetical protein
MRKYFTPPRPTPYWVVVGLAIVTAIDVALMFRVHTIWTYIGTVCVLIMLIISAFRYCEQHH